MKISNEDLQEILKARESAVYSLNINLQNNLENRFDWKYELKLQTPNNEDKTIKLKASK